MPNGGAQPALPAVLVETKRSARKSWQNRLKLVSVNSCAGNGSLRPSFTLNAAAGRRFGRRPRPHMRDACNLPSTYTKEMRLRMSGSLATVLRNEYAPTAQVQCSLQHMARRSQKPSGQQPADTIPKPNGLHEMGTRMQWDDNSVGTQTTRLRTALPRTGTFPAA